MLQTENFKQGHKAQTFTAEASARVMFAEIFRAHPGASEEQLYKRVMERLEEDDSYLPSIVRYWVKNTLKAAKDRAPTETAAAIEAKAQTRVARKAEREAAVVKETETIKVRAVQMVLLDMALPNGKLLRDATAADCRKAGGFFARVATKIPGRSKVGEVLSEADVRKLYNR